jgi:hypothetical protein
MTCLITITGIGADAGPTFDLYTNVDGFVTPFETGVPRASLEAGYSSSVVPDATNTIRIKSVGVCTTYVDTPTPLVQVFYQLPYSDPCTGNQIVFYDISLGFPYFTGNNLDAASLYLPPGEEITLYMRGYNTTGSGAMVGDFQIVSFPNWPDTLDAVNICTASGNTTFPGESSLEISCTFIVPIGAYITVQGGINY